MDDHERLIRDVPVCLDLAFTLASESFLLEGSIVAGGPAFLVLAACGHRDNPIVWLLKAGSLVAAGVGLLVLLVMFDGVVECFTGLGGRDLLRDVTTHLSR